MVFPFLNRAGQGPLSRKDSSLSDSGFVNPDLLKKIRHICMMSGKNVNTIMAGQYRSVFRGSGMEFEEVREYTPGDEVKSIDWKVSARSGRPYVKLFREERQAIVMLILDMSSSLSFGSFHGRILEKAAETAAILAYNAVKNNDRVGVIFFTDQVETYIPPGKGTAHVWRIIREMFTIRPKSRGTDVSCALEYLGKVMKKRCVAFVLSDFLGADYEVALKTACRKHELMGIRMTDQRGSDLPAGGIVCLEDSETGQKIMVDAFHGKTRKAFSQHFSAIDRHTKEVFFRAGTDLVTMDTSDNAPQVLASYFRKRQMRFR